MASAFRPRLNKNLTVHFCRSTLRSKRKLLGRRDSEQERHHILSSSSSSSSSQSWETSTDSLPYRTRPASLGSHRSAKSESFKALLLRKGSRADLSSRISAVERLRVIPAPSSATILQRAPAPPPAPGQVKPVNPSHTADDISSHLTLNGPPSACTLAMMFRWRRRVLTHGHLLLTSSSSSSPVFVLSSSHMRPRSLTPPCSASRRFAARCRLFAAPMTAIHEGEGEEEDDDVFAESPGDSKESNLSLVEISWSTGQSLWAESRPWMCLKLLTTAHIDLNVLKHNYW